MDIIERVKSNLKNSALGQYKDIEQGDEYCFFPKLEGEISNRMVFQGQEVIVWSLNNYLGLANHPEIRKADKEGAEKYGLAHPMGARMMSGNTILHDQLEQELAKFVQKPAALLVNYGYQGILSAIDCLLDRNDVVIYDSDSHASIIDGTRLHIGQRFRFKHNNVEDLEKQLKRAQSLIQKKGSGGILVISEGVFGMTGRQGKLKEIVQLKEKYHFTFLVDDAHGFGVLGKDGSGVGVEQGVQDQIDIYFSTFAKSMAGIGGFFAAEKEVLDYLRYNMRSQFFAKSIPSPMIYGLLKRLEIIKKNPSFKQKLWENVNQLQSGLKNAGFNLGGTNSPVTPVYIEGKASVWNGIHVIQEMREKHKVFCSIIVYPVIPKGTVIFRMIPTAVHTSEDIDYTISVFMKIKAKLKGEVQKVIN